jgi:O-antigen/teichoic acid export membrane protein
VAKRQLRFGLLVQGTGLISVVKDSITPIFIGLLLGRAAVGLVDWAQVVAAYPVLVLLILHRLYLPAFSRMQDHPERLGGFVEQVLRATNGFVAPLAVLTLVLIDPVTRLVFGEKWVAAMPLFHLFWAANLFVPTAVPLLALATALGLARAAFGFTLLWAAGTWLLGVPLILRFGLLGYGLANVAVQLTNLMLFRFLQARVSFRILPIAAPYWVAAGAIGGVIFAAERFVPATGVPALAGYFFAGLSAYALALVVVHPGETRRAFAWIQRAGWHLASR